MPFVVESMALILGVSQGRIITPCGFGQMSDGSGRLGVRTDNVGWNYVADATWQFRREGPLVVLANSIDHDEELFQQLVALRRARTAELHVASISFGFIEARLTFESLQLPLHALVVSGGSAAELVAYEDEDMLREQMHERFAETGALVIRQDAPDFGQELRRAIVICPEAELQEEVLAI